MKSPFFRLVPGLALATGLMMTACSVPAAAQVPLLVTTLGDTLDPNDGVLSLREALAMAVASSSGANISFAPSIQGAVALSEPLPAITRDAISIDGGGRIVLDGGGRVRALRVEEDGGLEVRGLSVLNASASDEGAAIRSSGTLRARDCRFEGNSALSDGGAVFSSGTASIARCVFKNNSSRGTGGALDNEAEMTVAECIFEGNSARDDGGAFYSGGALDLRSSAFWDNSTRGTGGALHVISSEGGVSSVESCSFWNNSARGGGGAISLYDGELSLSHLTITGNRAPLGSGIASYGDTATFTRLDHSIVAGNQDGADLDLFESSSMDDEGEEVSERVNSFFSRGYNLLGTLGEDVVMRETGDRTGLDRAALRLGEPQLSGATIPVLVPAPGSPAIDAGNPAFDASGRFDGRGEGFERRRGERVDIGAVEA